EPRRGHLAAPRAARRGAPRPDLVRNRPAGGQVARDRVPVVAPRAARGRAMTATRSISEYRLYGAIRSQPMELDRLLSAPEPVDEAAEVLARAERVFTIGI